MSLSAHKIKQYYVFLASPGDVNDEREQVRQFFNRFNQHAAQIWNVRFEVIDWENYVSIGVGRPQELITKQTLNKYQKSLALVVGIMGQRFGSPTGKSESGTEEEFNWAIESNQKIGFPEIKWFFKKVESLEVPIDPDEAELAIDQWRKVCDFKSQMKSLDNPVFYTEYKNPDLFSETLEHDLNLWLMDGARPWIENQSTETAEQPRLAQARKYYESIENDFYRLDISGIDNDRAFEIPLSEIYVRLRVLFDEDNQDETSSLDDGPIDIQTALLRYKDLVIVGDPGSGKSTFLKYIALMIARSYLACNSSIALEKLCINEPLPLPIFLSCWDLADFLKVRKIATVDTLIEFIVERLSVYGFVATSDDVEALMESGSCCLLFDGLDEVPTDSGRAAVSRLLEGCVKKYGDNRYVVTSRVRGYTGDTILKGKFTRCDIQPFDTQDRTEFIRNWVALLFKVNPIDVELAGSEACREFNSLTNAIENNERIRPLAINPLLLTVIAIVHWNRKRLPEQRGELYDECVDVLLGQRKEAERIQQRQLVDALDEDIEEKTHEERAWVRKRFAEIALHIMCQEGDDDEATKAEVVKLIAPRFVDQGALNLERAAARAELFLRRQELQSGILVSRRAQSYRFVHLTFQEYLAAWQLSNMDFDKVTGIIACRLRSAKWFETLQLLGSQWAKESDDKVDSYVSWLLDNRGESINEQAPVVALCANIVKDIYGIADLDTVTRNEFKQAVEATLDVFRKGSGVDVKTQLEILEALGSLGSAVKSHLIDATKASRFQVRQHAIEMLIPHLSDDELFSVTHILKDRSRKPIKHYLQALLLRDEDRTINWLKSIERFTAEAATSILSLPARVKKSFDPDMIRKLMESRVIGERTWDARVYAAEELLEKWNDERTRSLIYDRLLKDHDPWTRSAMISIAAKYFPDDDTKSLFENIVTNDWNPDVIVRALSALSSTWTDDSTRNYVIQYALNGRYGGIRSGALNALSDVWPDDDTHQMILSRINVDKDYSVQIACIEILSTKWPDDTARELITNIAVHARESAVRHAACQSLFRAWPDDRTMELIEELCEVEENLFVQNRLARLIVLASLRD